MISSPKRIESDHHSDCTIEKGTDRNGGYSTASLSFHTLWWKKNVTYFKKNNKNGDLSYTSVIYIERDMISSNRERNIAHKGMMKLGKYIGKSPKLN